MSRSAAARRVDARRHLVGAAGDVPLPARGVIHRAVPETLSNWQRTPSLTHAVITEPKSMSFPPTPTVTRRGSAATDVNFCGFPNARQQRTYDWAGHA